MCGTVRTRQKVCEIFVDIDICRRYIAQIVLHDLDLPHEGQNLKMFNIFEMVRAIHIYIYIYIYIYIQNDFKRFRYLPKNDTIAKCQYIGNNKSQHNM